ncbi:MAG: galactokinase [Fimbriimonadaceae bacterium]|nr:galactokinase [Fimbriimonadaceae bacterium]
MRMLPAEAERVIERHERVYGVAPTHIALAPGRINLIGEHTDYQGGFVFPAAIDRYVIVATSLASGPTRLVSDHDPHAAEFDANTVNLLDKDRLPTWVAYPAGMAWALQGRLPNINATVGATLPVGSGLSSSAAIEMAFGTLWRLLGELEFSDAELALAGQRAENQFVGMNCGIMDQTASLFGVADHALFVDTLRPGEPEPIRLPEGLAMVVCDTRVKHALQGSEYNDRRRDSESAARKLGVEFLREANLEMLAGGGLTEVEFKRALHIITENQRVLEFRKALPQYRWHPAGNPDLQSPPVSRSSRSEFGERGRDGRATLGELMRASHESLRDDYEVSCPELDLMAEAAWGHEACIGARMMGGGFGGACIALVQSEGVQDFIVSVGRNYLERSTIEGSFIVVKAVAGAAAWRL